MDNKSLLKQLRKENTKREFKIRNYQKMIENTRKKLKNDIDTQIQYNIKKSETKPPVTSTVSKPSKPLHLILLENLLESPDAKNILGIGLSSDLQKKIANFDSKASRGLASILNSLITANRGKKTIHTVNKSQLKRIIEGFISTLSVLLNPMSK